MPWSHWEICCRQVASAGSVSAIDFDESPLPPYTFKVAPGVNPGVFVRGTGNPGSCAWHVCKMVIVMSAAHNLQPRALDDTRINVSALLMDDTGATRHVDYRFDSLPLADDLTARDVQGSVEFTRLQHSILATGEFTGIVTLECVRCLNDYEQEFTATFAEEFHQLVDVRTGAAIAPRPSETAGTGEDDDDSEFVIDENHELDIAEAVRQWIILSLPMQPNCGPNCPGPLLTQTDPESVGDARLAGLAALLGDDDDEPAGSS